MVMKKYAMSGRENRYALMNMPEAYVAFDLYESVDMSAMNDAMLEAIKYHPLFGMKIVFDNGLFCFEENPEPPVLFCNDNAPKMYGGEENNYYPWLMVVNDRRLILYTNHTVSDGTGRFSFVKTMLHLYFERMGVEFSDMETDFPKCSPEETMEDAYEKYVNPNCEPVGVPRFVLPSVIPDELLDREKNQPWLIKVPFDAVRKLYKSSETSSFSVIACILARAEAKTYGIESGNISVRVPVNYRAAFPSETDRNFAGGFSLRYNADKMNSMPDEMVETAFRSQLDINIEKGNLNMAINADMAQLDRLINNPNELQKILNFKPPEVPRANVLLTLINSMGFSKELMSRVEDVNFGAHIIQTDFVSVYGLGTGSEIKLIIHQCSKDDRYIDALCEVLEGRGIPYTLSPFEMEPERICRNTSDLIH